MQIVLWIVQVLIALAFLAVGFPKLVMPLADLSQQMDWVNDLSPALVRFIGLAEVAGGLGLILPALTRILPWLTPLAAAGLVLIMILAAVFHISRGEIPFIIPNLVLLALAAFVAYGRWKIAPIAGR